MRAKLILAALLAILAEQLFYCQWIGSTIGGFAFAWIVALMAAVPAVRRRPGARFALLVATLFAATLVYDPGLLGWALFWAAISSAGLLARARFGDMLRWSVRLLAHLFIGWIRWFGDGVRILRIRSPKSGIAGGRSLAALISLLALPLIGGGIFLTLFASANPLIADAIDRIRIPSPVSIVPQLAFAGLAFFAVWPSLRPHPFVTRPAIGAPSFAGVLPQVPAASIILSLLTFNAVFALQNSLDIIFLWSGARLPGTITMADYAHRGAYALIATALLAALFVLTVLSPRSPTSKRASVRLLVTLWVAQNLLLVASSILRTLDYVGSYSLTVMRIAALAWMLLVGLGLVLILWRLLTGRSTAWLINTNAFAAGAMLLIGCAADPAAIAADWNVRHAREVGGPAQPIDLCYLRNQGASALLPLIELESAARDPEFLDRVRTAREEVLRITVLGQSDWHSWTWRNAGRLAAAQAALGANPPRPRTAYGTSCTGDSYREDPLSSSGD
ncbi:DUF4173 domain-containing protein [Sphingomonas sp. LB-2]|uniref:DUF4153 domain-containing protein n=1 Tax=Sphingomonas caeni TaxID=2984949 RepID=UPI0022316D8C|nr:DUF4173 domain-containing protein [Sphingomonas caeni]MCW3846177.1 DUF4173 domain-containing protein [Sphingomonas caeni]